MGLDMYLQKVKKVEGYSMSDYRIIDNTIDNVAYEITKANEEKGIKLKPNQVIEQVKKVNLANHTDVDKPNELLEELYNRNDNPDMDWLWTSVMHKLAYWRKANHIHAWFVSEVQNGVDDCGDYEVSKVQLKKLIYSCKMALAHKDNPEKLEKLLPTQSGFFFGNVDYNEYYFQSLENTIEMLEKALNETDFDKEVVFYCSSW